MEYIDKVFYINLDRRTDRLAEIRNELASVGLTNKAERFKALEHKEPCVGCSMSHAAVLDRIVKGGYKNTLILEDDFTFLVGKEELESLLDEFFRRHGEEYDCVMFSYNHDTAPTECDDTVSHVMRSRTASGYMVSHRFADKLQRCIASAIPLFERTLMHWLYQNDVVWFPLQVESNWYCFKKRVGRQRAGYSDLGGGFRDYEC